MMTLFAGTIGLRVVDGVVVVPPALDVDLLDPAELELEGLEVCVEEEEVVEDFALLEGSGVNGLRGGPDWWWEPLVVSETASLGLGGAGLMAITPTLPVTPVEALLGGGGAGLVEEPPLRTA
jgi:hypothetical protein